MMMSAVDFVMGLIFDFPYFDIYFFGRPFNVFSALACGLLRCMSGEFTAKDLDKCERPKKPLKVYEFEACPYCRKVREAMNTLDLDFEVYPCPKPAMKGQYGSDEGRFRTEVAVPGQKSSFPVLVDENISADPIRGSEEIVTHLWKTYGAQATPPLNYTIGRRMDAILPLFLLPAFFRLRTSCGMLATPSRKPEKLLVLYGYEPSPFVKIVREALCCLQIPYTYVSVGHGSDKKRNEFSAKYGQNMRQKDVRSTLGAIQVPMLIDPNQGGDPIFESAHIVKYLYDTYGSNAASKSD